MKKALFVSFEDSKVSVIDLSVVTNEQLQTVVFNEGGIFRMNEETKLFEYAVVDREFESEDEDEDPEYSIVNWSRL